MRKKIITATLFFFFIVPLFPLEISNVVRDFYYPNIFIYKDHLIGNSEVNKFYFGGENLTDDEKAEFFDVYVNSSEYELGKLLKVTFSYKPAKKKEFISVSKEVRIDKRKQKVRFLFDSELQKTYGRVELWEVKLFQNDKLIGGYKPKANRWR